MRTFPLYVALCTSVSTEMGLPLPFLLQRSLFSVRHGPARKVPARRESCRLHLLLPTLAQCFLNEAKNQPSILPHIEA